MESKGGLGFCVVASRHRLRDARLRFLGFAAFLIHAFALPGALVLNHTMTVYYWFFAGFIFLLPRLDSRPPEGSVVERWSHR